jgi:hypothetical protein
MTGARSWDPPRPTRRPWTRRRLGSVALAVAAAAVGLVLFGPLLYQLTTGMTLEETTAQSRGELTILQVDELDRLPEGSHPDWLPDSASDITLKVDGPDAAADVARKVDAAVGPAPQPPSQCTASDGVRAPFDGGGGWPALDPDRVLDCGDGWSLLVESGRWYAWTGGDTSASVVG